MLRFISKPKENHVLQVNTCPWRVQEVLKGGFQLEGNSWNSEKLKITYILCFISKPKKNHVLQVNTCPWRVQEVLKGGKETPARG